MTVSPGNSRDVLVIKLDLIDLDETVKEPIILEKKIPKQMPLTLEAASI